MNRDGILFSGASGFLGSALISEFSKDLPTYGLHRTSSNLWRLKKRGTKSTLINIDRQFSHRILEKKAIDTFIHTATNYGRGGEVFAELMRDNVLYPLSWLKAGKQHGLTTFINCDTLQNESLNDYTITKKRFFDIAKDFSVNFQIINIQIEHMYGPLDDGKKFVYWLLQQLYMEVDEIPLTDGQQRRDFVFLDDIVSAFRTIYMHRSKLPNFSVFQVGTGKVISVREFVEELKSVFEFNLGRRIKTKLGFGKQNLRKGEATEICADISKIQRLGWEPKVKLETGLFRVVEDFLERN